MFVVVLTYVKPLADVEAQLEPHRAFLRAQYAAGHFLASGPQVPREGGVILARAPGRAALEAVLATDPFARHGIARYRVIEFQAIHTAPELAPVRETPR